MRTITFTEFRSKASLLLSEVEKGEVVIILRHGKPIAQISPPEIISALNRKLREKSISKRDYLKAKQRLIEDIESAVIINVVPEVISKSIFLLENNNLR